jgi:hypothetical protein
LVRSTSPKSGGASDEQGLKKKENGSKGYPAGKVLKKQHDLVLRKAIKTRKRRRKERATVLRSARKMLISRSRILLPSLD